jgi:acylglycerol lipase
MKFKKMLKALLFIVLFFVGVAFVLAYYPVADKTNHVGISEKRAIEIRNGFTGPHHLITTSDNAILFLRRWNPGSVQHEKIAILILHGITAYSGPYEMAGIPFAENGYTTFGLDYRGHGLSSGNRGDTPGTERWVKDMAETVAYIKKLGFSQVVVLGHSLGVAAAFSVANAIPNEISGLVLLSGAYEGREGISKPPSLLEKIRFFASAVLRPSYQSYQYYRDGMTTTKDSLFNFRYTPRFLLMIDVKTLRLPADMSIPVLVGIGDEDELFAVEKVRELYDLIPGDKKEFLVMKNATHAKIPRESWMQVVEWLDRTYTVK